MSAVIASISTCLVKKAIPFYPPKPSPAKATKPHSLLLSSAMSPMRKITNNHHVSNFGQFIPPEIPGRNTPPEIPRNPGYRPPSVPPEVPEILKSSEIEIDTPPEVNTQPLKVPEVPNPGPDYVPPLPTPPTPPDIPLPPPGTPRPQPPNRLPPKLPPDPDILPPPVHHAPDIQPPPDMPPDIKPPPGPGYVAFFF